MNPIGVGLAPPAQDELAFNIGLPFGSSHFTEARLGDNRSWVIGSHQILRHGVWFHPIEPDFPNAIRRNGGNLLAGECHGDFLPLAPAAPDRHALVALENGVVLKRRVQFRRDSGRGESAKNAQIILVVFFMVQKFAGKSHRSLFRNGGVGNVHELGDGLRTRADMQLFVDAADVRVDRRQTDVQRLGDFFGAITTRNEFEHFAFARRKIVRLNCRVAAEPLE